MYPIVTKRDGSQVSFSSSKIQVALEKCFGSLNTQPVSGFDAIVSAVETEVLSKYSEVVNVEQIQDIVEFQLHQFDEFDAAKSYILYRANRTAQRNAKQIPDDVKKAFSKSEQYFPTPIQKFQFFDIQLNLHR